MIVRHGTDDQRIAAIRADGFNGDRVYVVAPGGQHPGGPLSRWVDLEVPEDSVNKVDPNDSHTQDVLRWYWLEVSTANAAVSLFDVD